MPDQLARQRSTTLLFYGCIILLGYLLYQLFEPFLSAAGVGGHFRRVFHSRHKQLEARFGKTAAASISTGRRCAHHRRAVRAHRHGVHRRSEADARVRSTSRPAAREGSIACSARGAGCSGSDSGETSRTSMSSSRWALRESPGSSRKAPACSRGASSWWSSTSSSCCSRCSFSFATATRSWRNCGACCRSIRRSAKAASARPPSSSEPASARASSSRSCRARSAA